METHKQKILIISPHLDDETIGAGGTLLYHKARGDKLYWINVTLPQNEQKRIRRLEEQKLISNHYKFYDSYQLNFDSTTLEGLNRKMVLEFTKLFNEIKPNIVYLPNRSDVHSDHRYIFQAVYSCTKSFRQPSIEKILMYETLSETEFAPPLVESVFIPNIYVNITDFFDLKIEAMKIYKNEIMVENYPRTLSAMEALAHWRGTRIGARYAEAFSLIFEKL